MALEKGRDGKVCGGCSIDGLGMGWDGEVQEEGKRNSVGGSVGRLVEMYGFVS